ncbi:transmembrane protein 26-like [Ruditapes philippinarum]|uniref:transmembrane protein 26-like n=1 Tax=Ruditapes philippinarum TaxID=129788 RepID=UPI00295BB700|nr:transmembrane protein 26-like [Ruditapes philippinarum]
MDLKKNIDSTSNENKKVKNGFKWSTIIAALSVRCLLVLHNILAVWRVVISHDNASFWGLASLNILILIETYLVIRRNYGNEWKWWCPCFLTYLLATLPSVWLLQLSLYDSLVSTNTDTNSVQPTPQGQIATTSPISASSEIGNFTNTTSSVSTTMVTTTNERIASSIDEILALEDTTWIVVIQESLVYLLVFGRWILPRSEVSRAALSDLLLEYLAIASDIMELYAIFDEDVVQSNFGATYAILTIWSISFLQFVPVLVFKQKYRHLQSPRMSKINRACGEYFAEVVVTLTSILLQDGPFLCLRLYIMLRFELITYSLVFFVLKNIVAVLLLIYRLVILCIRLPCCYHDNGEVVDVESVDFSRPVVLQVKADMFRRLEYYKTYN